MSVSVGGKSIVLLSGGMDSAVTLYVALRESTSVETLVFEYGQRAVKEVACAVRLAEKTGVVNHVLDLALNSGGSALTDLSRELPGEGASQLGRIPATYVPARNLVFLAHGVHWAESVGADAIYIGAHQLDYSNYPDCRADFFEAFRQVVATGTRSGAEGRPVRIVTPVLDMTKKNIILLGEQLGVPFEDTWSCYSQAVRPCGLCESCVLREKAFREAGREDPLLA